MKNYITLLIALIGFTAFSQSDCKRFKTGKFENIEDGKVSAIITRTNTIQSETVGKVKVKLKVEWIDDCTYRLKFLEGNEAFWESWPKGKPTLDLVVSIVKTTPNSYFLEAQSEGEDFVYKSEIRKVE